MRLTTSMLARDTVVYGRGCSVVRNGKATPKSHIKSLHNYIHLLHRWLNPFGDADVYSYAITCCEIGTGPRKSGFHLELLHGVQTAHRILNPRSDNGNPSEIFGTAT